MSGQYASKTSVSVEKSQAEIQSILKRYGVEDFAVATRKGVGSVIFDHKDLSIRIDVPLPDKQDPAYTKTETGKARTAPAMFKAWEQANKQRWRALLLAIKAKLEAVETGISTIEREFMPFVVMPDGRPLHEHIQPKLEQFAASGQMPDLLALPPGSES